MLFVRAWIAGLWFSLSLSPAHAGSSGFTLDVDADGKTEPLTDGLLIMRHLFDFEGETLTSSAVGSDATRSNPREIKDHLNKHSTKLDIDDDGTLQPLTDGLLIIRSLFDFSDEALISNAVANTGSRNTASAIETYLQLIKDTDGDGVVDSLDAFAFDPKETLDSDSDGIGKNTDTDDDGDGVLDTADAFPLDATETIDTDTDGIGNNADADDDGDGLSDMAEAVLGTDPLLTDSDSDGSADNLDVFPLDATETIDTDSDGIGNNKDTDDDSDGIPDGSDAFPLDATETKDTDSDGMGNNTDTDDDGDGVLDVDDAYPLISLGGLVDSDQDGFPNDCNSSCINNGMVADDDDDNDGISDDADFAPIDPLRPASLDWDSGNWGETKWY